MKKTVYIGENNLVKIKNAMAGESISHSAFMREDKPPYEKDEYEIGGEGSNNDFFHINENRLRGIDLCDVGAVNYEWYFDEDEYEEWLQDNEITDSEEVRNQYYTEEVTYGVEYVDSYSFHHMESDQNLLYDDLIDLFGEDMAKQMLATCIKNGEGRFETYELYSNNTYDISNDRELNDIAMKLFSHGEYYKGCRGFILSNGVVVYTPNEHNEICMIPGVNDKFDFVKMGNIRVLENSIDIGAEPTAEQEDVLRQVISSYSDDKLFVDIFDKGSEIGVKYINPNWRYVMGEINRYYSDGIKPQGNDYYESRNNKRIIEAYSKNVPQELIDRAIKLRAYGNGGNWCVIDNLYLSMMPRYFQKRSAAVEFKKWLGRGFLVDLDKYQKINENQLLILKENSFDEWFGNSVLKDAYGMPIKMYHGTDSEFNSFSKDFIGSTGSYEGYGFNFTPYESKAKGYNSKNVIEAYLKAENPMTSKSNNISLKDLIKIIAELDEGKEYTDTIVAAYEPAGYGEKWDAAYYRRALPVAAKTIYQYNIESEYGDAGIYAEICINGNADKFKTIEVFEKLGYDSAIFYDNDGRINTVVVFEPNQIKRTSNKTFDLNSDIMDENFKSKNIIKEPQESKNKRKNILVSENQLITLKENIETEVEASEVNLDSFKKNDTLATEMWDGFDLDPRVRLKLLDIADDFWDFVNISWVKPKGIHLTGSICNFNWSKYSDIDLHIVVDFSEIDDRKDFVQEYFDAKKNEWNNEHSNLKIFDYPVEVYVEDVDAETNSGGIYDLEENDWINKPSKDGIKPIGLNKYSIKDKSAEIMTDIDDLYDAFKKTDDDAELREIGKKARYMLDYVKEMRKKGLNRGGESDSFNIIYKVLRRTGYMDILWNLSSELYDKINSIGIDESVIKEGVDLFELAKNYFGVTKNIMECGFILPDGSMLDLSGRHTGAKESDVSGRRRIDHRTVEHIGGEDTIVSLSKFIEAGAIRCDCRGGFINLIKRPTPEQVQVLSKIIRMNDGFIGLEIGDDDIHLDYVDYDGVNYKRVINDIFNFFDNKINPSSLMECIENIADEINKKKLVAEEKGIHICDFSFVL